MQVGTLIARPDQYSHFGRLRDTYGNQYTVESSQIPQGSDVGDKLAYKVEIWGNESGIAYNLEEP
ncbi:MAG: hypothetical protein KA436_03050 [Oligoflexales bacterium]|nr:hypothetical protein [Oligoflexales bacterium]